MDHNIRAVITIDPRGAASIAETYGPHPVLVSEQAEPWWAAARAAFDRWLEDVVERERGLVVGPPQESGIREADQVADGGNAIEGTTLAP